MNNSPNQVLTHSPMRYDLTRLQVLCTHAGGARDARKRLWLEQDVIPKLNDLNIFATRCIALLPRRGSLFCVSIWSGENIIKILKYIIKTLN